MTASPDESLTVLQFLGPRTVRLALRGDLDYDTGDEVVRTVRHLLGEHTALRELRLDCRELGTVDSTGLSVLLMTHRLAGRQGISFHLDHIGPKLRRMLEITGTYEHLNTSLPGAPATGTTPDIASEP
ncbi:STAS domain-containing protein [Streptomyces sp. NPDC047130]|uniref:STAS domain-containing protein n=1 Tax=Streptomyces sp. NPDC047130 TaxID=3155261 RepID=UPI0033E05F88